jgi:hypothetical protein
MEKEIGGSVTRAILCIRETVSRKAEYLLAAERANRGTLLGEPRGKF